MKTKCKVEGCDEEVLEDCNNGYCDKHCIEKCLAIPTEKIQEIRSIKHGKN